MSESGKVVVTKSKLDGLANAINDKAKSPGPKTIAQLTQTVNNIKTDAPVTSVNGKTGAVQLNASDVGAVPTSRTVNGKALSANITLTASDVGAATMTQVNSAIQTAIGDAIGGNY